MMRSKTFGSKGVICIRLSNIRNLVGNSWLMALNTDIGFTNINGFTCKPESCRCCFSEFPVGCCISVMDLVAGVAVNVCRILQMLRRLRSCSIVNTSLKPWLVWHGAHPVAFSKLRSASGMNDFPHCADFISTSSELSWQTPQVAVPSVPLIPCSPSFPEALRTFFGAGTDYNQ